MSPEFYTERGLGVRVNGGKEIEGLSSPLLLYPRM